MLKNKKLKNIILLILLFVGAAALTLYLCDCYKVYDEYQKQTPVIRGTLSEINKDEVDHFILENPDTTVYMCTSNSEECRNYEKNLKRLLSKMNVEESIVYLNISENESENFVSEFNKKYQYKINLTTSYPAFVNFEDGEIKYILQGTESKPLTISKTKQFFELNHIGE